MKQKTIDTIWENTIGKINGDVVVSIIMYSSMWLCVFMITMLIMSGIGIFPLIVNLAICAGIGVLGSRNVMSYIDTAHDFYDIRIVDYWVGTSIKKGWVVYQEDMDLTLDTEDIYKYNYDHLNGLFKYCSAVGRIGKDRWVFKKRSDYIVFKLKYYQGKI